MKFKVGSWVTDLIQYRVDDPRPSFRVGLVEEDIVGFAEVYRVRFWKDDSIDSVSFTVLRHDDELLPYPLNKFFKRLYEIV